MGSSPNLVQGQQPTASQWNGYFIEKADDEVFTGDGGTGGIRGLVPAPPAGSGAAGFVLRANGVWAAVPTPPITFSQTFAFDEPASGATVTMSSTIATVSILLLLPASELATLNVVLPPNPDDLMVVELGTIETIDALTVTAAALIYGGGPFTLTANGGASWRYSATLGGWTRRY